MDVPINGLPRFCVCFCFSGEKTHSFQRMFKRSSLPLKKKKKWSVVALQCVLVCCTTKWIRYVYTYISSLLGLPPSPTPVPSIWVIAELSVLYNSFPLAIDTCSIYVSMLLSQFIPPSSPPLCVHMSVSYVLDLYSCLANKFICIVFLGSTYMC